jgi:hypothetical protein
MDMCVRTQGPALFWEPAVSPWPLTDSGQPPIGLLSEMAPKKDVNCLGAVQSHGDGWRAEVTKVGKGPARALYAEAVADLELARQAPSRDDMRQVLHQLLADAHDQQPAGQPLVADGHADPAGRQRSRSR